MAGVWRPRGVTMLFILAGVYGMFTIVEAPVTLAFGRDAAGRVERVTRYRGRHPDSHHFDLVFTYQLPGDTPQTGDGLIDTGGAKPPTVGQALPVRVLRIGRIHFAELRDGNPGASGWVCAGLFMLVWCGLATLFTLAAWWTSAAARAPVRDGQAAAGTVVGTRRRRTGRSNRCEILYRFIPVDGQERSAVQFATSKACDQF